MRKLRSIRRLLSADVMRALVQEFVYCRLDYCNSLLTGTADVLLKRLHSVQNAAARLVSWARGHDHTSPVLSYDTPLASSAQDSDVQDCGVGVEMS